MIQKTLSLNSFALVVAALSNLILMLSEEQSGNNKRKTRTAVLCSLFMRDNGPINVFMFRGGTAEPCLLSRQVAASLMLIKEKIKKEREGKQPYALFAQGVTALPNFAYNGQTSIILFAHGVAVSIHCN